MAMRLSDGIFLAPFHPLDEDPTLCIQRDLELIEHLDRLGYEEASVGEHHSGGFEIITSPEVFIAAAAERTKRIRLGTGVVSLPYHNPLTAANRIGPGAGVHPIRLSGPPLRLRGRATRPALRNMAARAVLARRSGRKERIRPPIYTLPMAAG